MDWKRPLRPLADRYPDVADRYRRFRTYRRLAFRRGTLSFEEFFPDQAFRLGYSMILRREPDDHGTADFLPLLESRQMPYDVFVERLAASEEFRIQVPISGPSLPFALHASRSDFVRSLPRANRILDIGGAHGYREEGALLSLGYPYPFEDLVIVDLPSEDRHPLYQSAEHDKVATPLGSVSYRYHSMTDLSGYDDASFDLVYSGQSIEHVTEEEGELVLKDVLRVLRPGGFLALDTPNGRATRAQQDELIDPDHKVEYTHEELSAKLERAGFRIREAKGLNWLGRALAEGRYSADEAAAHVGMYDEIRDCYLLAYVCEKPATTPSPS